MLKKKYRLTDEELNSNKLFVMNFRSHGCDCKTYLVTDIHDLAGKLTKDLDEDNPKKTAYLKQKAIIDQRQKDKEDIIEAKNKITTSVYDLLSKYNNIEMSIPIKDKIKELTDQYYNEKTLNDFAIALKIVDDVNNYYVSETNKAKRKNDLEKLLTENIPESYLEFIYKDFSLKHTEFQNAYSGGQHIYTDDKTYGNISLAHQNIYEAHTRYNEYINNNTYTLQESYAMIKNIIDNHIKRSQLTQKKRKDLDTKLCENDITISVAQRIIEYNMYIYEISDKDINHMDIDITVNSIKASIEINKRRQQLKKIINDKEMIYYDLTKQQFYNDFVYGKISLESAEKILDELYNN